MRLYRAEVFDGLLSDFRKQPPLEDSGPALCLLERFNLVSLYAQWTLSLSDRADLPLASLQSTSATCLILGCRLLPMRRNAVSAPGVFPGMSSKKLTKGQRGRQICSLMIPFESKRLMRTCEPSLVDLH